MGRRLYYRDSYGRVHRDRQAERGSSAGSALSARFALIVLLALAVLVVLASIHLRDPGTALALEVGELAGLAGPESLRAARPARCTFTQMKANQLSGVGRTPGRGGLDRRPSSFCEPAPACRRALGR